jgi:DNA-binding transcriptional LysR family regulator
MGLSDLEKSAADSPVDATSSFGVSAAVVNLPVDDPDLAVEPLFSEDMYLLVTSSHPLAASTEVTLAEVADHPLLLPAPGTALRADIEAEAARAGVHLEPLAEIDGVRLMTSLAFEGFGATIVPATADPLGSTATILGLVIFPRPQLLKIKPRPCN